MLQVGSSLSLLVSLGGNLKLYLNAFCSVEILTLSKLTVITKKDIEERVFIFFVLNLF